ncbi:tyrosine-type recombinase/integrase [Blastopirellula marina]|uniref:Tyr recombinase domain-containing protein n=1 Tax=Blastopirellula marina TaxID=124 RepID=A0A2S8GQM0_9BACT|nr:site-specific integrase [Blastopirellula marina]PQO46728.1 hypothetical protein C5Y93_07795 [Blastopirellula marina]
MGSFYKDGTSYRYKFIDHLGKTRKLNFGGTRPSKREQGYLDSNVTHLVSCRKNGCLIDPKVQLWLSQIHGSPIAKRLALWGLIAMPGVATLGEYLDWLFDQKLNQWKDADGNAVWSPSTERGCISTKNYLIQYFTADRAIHAITAGDAEEWLQWMRSAATKSNRPAAISKHVKRVRSWFGFAARKKWVQENPFTWLPTGSQVDRERILYMSPEEAETVLAHLTYDQHRLFFVLGRFGGLRLPSEVADLRWSHFDFDSKTIQVPPAKTKVRTMPLWPEIRDYAWPEFKEWQDSERTDDYVIHRHRTIDRDGRSVISTKIVAIMKQAMKLAGLEDFRKPMQNLRTSCENDLRLIVPEGRLTEFMGHTSKVAELHYRKTTKQEFANFANVRRLAPDEGENEAESLDQTLDPHGPEMSENEREEEFSEAS